MTGSIREPAVAGSFYPAEPGALQAALAAHLARPADWPGDWDMAPKAILAPHAGYVYSGPIAGRAYAMAVPRAGRVTRVVILGPAHRLAFRGIALPDATHLRTPLGDLPVDAVAVGRLGDLPFVGRLDAAFDREHAIEVQLPFVQATLGAVAIVPLLVGDATPEQVETVLARLWGGPETLFVISSDLSHYETYERAQQIDAATIKLIETHRHAALDGARACGHRAIAAMLRRAAALDLRVTTLDLRNSGDTAGDRARVVGYGAAAMEYAHVARLPEMYRFQVRQAARQALATVARGSEVKVALDSYPAPLRSARRAFVTLRNPDDTLRGCTGWLEPESPLILSVLRSTIRTATADPRFPRVTPEEAAGLQISVSLLSQDRPVPAGTEAELIAALRPDVDGLVIRDGAHEALFLPQVWHTLPDPREFLRHLRAKAGLPPDHWSGTLRAWRFGTESF